MQELESDLADMEDEDSDIEFKELIITYTDDITEVVPPLGKDKNVEVTKDHSCLDYLFME